MNDKELFEEYAFHTMAIPHGHLHISNTNRQYQGPFFNANRE